MNPVSCHFPPQDFSGPFGRFAGPQLHLSCGGGLGLEAGGT